MSIAQGVFKKALVGYGQGDYRCYRIPGIVITAKGTLLVYYEDRLEGDDWSSRNIEIKRSTDNGSTWSAPMRVFKQHPDNTVSNPVMIACRNGLVHLLWNIDYERSFYQISRNDGLSFSEPIEITAQLLPWRKDYPWHKAVFGPCHGIELKNGRLLVPVWLCNNPERRHLPSVVSTLASDDGGVSWHCGEIIRSESESFIENLNETCVAQLSDGRVMLNMRHADPNYFRAISYSTDGLSGFTPPVLDDDLPDPICCAGLAASPNGDLFFSNCASGAPSNSPRPPRHHLTLHRSTDGGESWRCSKEIEMISGYSDIAVSNDGKWVFCFYESEWENGNVDLPHQLVVARIPADYFD